MSRQNVRVCVGECETCGQSGWLDHYGMCGACGRCAREQAEVGFDLMREFLAKHAMFDAFLHERGMA